jgi:3-deoxy-7-phosphoheptulonate synthase
MKNNELIANNGTFKSINEIFGTDEESIIFAGPCSVENLEQMEAIAKVLAESKVRFIRAGAFKPRTSPYEFQGLGIEGLKILDYIRKKYNLLAVSEIVDTKDIENGLLYTDIIQVGSRNMHNYALLKELGKTQHPVLLKRGMMSSVKEFLMASEYILSSGNMNLILCERGIRTFEDSTRNTLDISCIAIIKETTSLPVIADLSHSLGRKDIIYSIAKSVFAAGADGIMVEVHNDPQNALSDKEQQLSLYEFTALLRCISEFNANMGSRSL